MRRKERKKEREIRRKRKSKKAGWVGLELAITKKDFLQEWTLCVVYIHIFYCLMEKHYSKHQLGTGKVGRSVGSTVYPRFFNLYQAGR